MRELFFHKAKGNYFLVIREFGDPVRCCQCGKVMEFGSNFVIQNSYSRRNYRKLYWCNRCVKHSKKQLYDEFISVTLTSIIPSNSILVTESKPMLRSANISVFDAAISNEGINADTSSVKIIDHTRLAGRDSLEGAKIGADISKKLEYLDTPNKKEVII